MKWIQLILRLILGGALSSFGCRQNLECAGQPCSRDTVFICPRPHEICRGCVQLPCTPRSLTNLVAITLPWVELLAGGLLICGIWKRASAIVITALMILFLAAISWAMAHGYNISCGCFGGVDARKVGVTALAQDAVLLAMAVWLAWRVEDKPQLTTETNS